MPDLKEIVRGIVKITLLLVILVIVAAGLTFAYEKTVNGEEAKLSLPTFNTSACSAGGAPEPQDVVYAYQLQQRQGDLVAAPSSDPTEAIFTIKPGTTATDVASDLRSQGFITDPDLFITLLKCRHASEKIQAGDHVLRRNMTMDQVISGLQKSFQRGVVVSIRPGWRAEEVAASLATAGLLNFDDKKFLALVKGGNLDFPILRDRPSKAVSSVEGYLLPETYQVLKDTTEEQLVNRFVTQFNQVFTDKMKQQAAAQKLTVYELMTVASIVEREAVIASERPIIASVYLNRVRKKMTLNADPTVQYAMGYQAATKQWWKTPVTLEEYAKVDSPFNTYLYPGLPPGPICEPSLASIQATLDPAQTDYFYFVAKGDGSHAFAKTLEEHNANLLKYGYTAPVVPTKKP